MGKSKLAQDKEVGALWVLVRIGDGKQVAGPDDYATMSERGTELAWNTRQKYAVIPLEDYNLPYTREDLQ